ncbi:ATP-dependent RNA helicase [Amanita muscaria]
MVLPVLSRKTSAKRKLHGKSAVSRKKLKTHHGFENLPWKKVSRPLETGLGGDDGILELEEVEGIEVMYEETERGRVARFKVCAFEIWVTYNISNSGNKVSDDTDGEGDQSTSRDAENKESVQAEGPSTQQAIQIDEREEVYEPFDSENLLPEWHSFMLHPQLLRTLHHKGFQAPTPIQAAALPVALKCKDVVGVAQTGSGKTLAYGLPILHYFLSQPRPSRDKRRQLRALVLAPTRELALQVSSHLNACLNKLENADESVEKSEKDKKKSKGKGKVTDENSGPKKRNPPPHVSVATIVGGMSPQKQHRILERGVDVLIATPGRLWDIIQDNDDLAKEIKTLKFLVLDEADRMIEVGHFAELENILRLTLRGNKDDEIPAEFNDLREEQTEEVNEQQLVQDELQTFVFSATLSKDLQRHLRRRVKRRDLRKGEKPASTLDDLLLRLDFRDSEPEVIDLSPAGGVVSTLQESKIECLVTDKDTYLYYFLLRYPGRTLVFLSSIDGIRRLLPLTELLNIKAFPLHSQLEQRQRLKNLDRFKLIENSVLLATDIAARGLDIPAVDHVIHYQVPRTADAYIHRNGRTARAMRKGFALLMCAPDERKVVKTLCGSLGRDESEIPEMSIELSLLDKLKARVQLARQIDAVQHKVRKVNHDRRWMKETAEVLGVELDSDYFSDGGNAEHAARKHKAQDAKTATLKAQLKQMLAQPILVKGISAKYITSGSRQIIDDLLTGEYNENMVGVKKTGAGSDLNVTKKKNKDRRR